MNKKVKAPQGYHWMKAGAGYKLMKNPKGGYKAHKGSKNQKKTQDEILRTRKMYREGALTPAMMDMISKQRSKSGKKTSKKKTSKKKKRRK